MIDTELDEIRTDTLLITVSIKPLIVMKIITREKSIQSVSNNYDTPSFIFQQYFPYSLIK